MRETLFAFGLAVALCGQASAQQNVMPSVEPGEEAYQPAALVPRSISGCLAFNGHRYIVSVVGEMPKQYRVIGGEKASLHEKVGHTVEVSGMAGKSDPREIVLNYNMLDATTGVGYDTISVDSVQDLLPNCSFAGFERNRH